MTRLVPVKFTLFGNDMPRIAMSRIAKSGIAITRIASLPVGALVALGLVATPATAQKKAAPRAKAAATKTREPAIAPSCPLPAGEVLVTMLTSLGPVEIALDEKRAPVTAGNFLAYVDQKRMDGATFYRVMKTGDPAKQEGVVQGGQRIAGKHLPPIAHEPTSVTGLRNVQGAISMARGAPGSATSDFFIMMNDIPAFDADPSKPGDNLGYAAFGHIAKGMALIRQIYGLPIDPTKGPMTGQMLADPVTITAARRTPLRKAEDPACAAPVPAPAAAPVPATTTAPVQ